MSTSNYSKILTKQEKLVSWGHLLSLHLISCLVMYAVLIKTVVLNRGLVVVLSGGAYSGVSGLHLLSSKAYLYSIYFMSLVSSQTASYLLTFNDCFCLQIFDWLFIISLAHSQHGIFEIKASNDYTSLISVSLSSYSLSLARWLSIDKRCYHHFSGLRAGFCRIVTP